MNLPSLPSIFLIAPDTFNTTSVSPGNVPPTVEIRSAGTGRAEQPDPTPRSPLFDGRGDGVRQNNPLGRS
jgi:hypothetical protein